MPDRKRHFIITCGTSQLSDRAIYNLELITPDTYITLREKTHRVSTKEFIHFPPPAEKKEAEERFIRFFEKLQEKCSLEEAPGFVGSGNNPMGAELSTLARLHKRGEWDPENDKITLLSSETYSALWCTAMLREMLVSWGVMRSKITPLVVEKLNENPANPEDAAISLARETMDANDAGRQNIVVMTGGFKSGIPVITVVALVYGMRLVYLFEEASEVQWIDLQMPDDGSLRPGAPRPLLTLPPALQDFFNKFGRRKTSGGATLSDFVRLVIDTWLGRNRPPNNL